MTDTTYEDDPTDEKVETLAQIICGGGGRCVAALLVLMGAIENSTSPKVLANVAKHFAFIRCGELNLYKLTPTARTFDLSNSLSNLSLLAARMSAYIDARAEKVE